MTTKPYSTNIEKLTLQNKYWRHVLYTDENIQLVIMNVPPLEEIDMEIHNGTQFIRVESGIGKVEIYENLNKNLKQVDLSDGDIIIIPSNHYHRVINISSKYSIKIYTIYSPPQHSPNEVQLNKNEFNE